MRVISNGSFLVFYKTGGMDKYMYETRRGKANAMLLPQVDMLERFIENITVKHQTWRSTKKSWSGRNKSTSACDWEGVKCQDGEVVEISWRHMNLVGFLQWDSLPRSLLTCNLDSNIFTGTIQLDLLPPQLTYLWLTCNSFSGELLLNHLPHTLETLNLGYNRFEGSVDLSHLPLSLLYLCLCSNQLSGGVNLSELP